MLLLHLYLTHELRAATDAKRELTFDVPPFPLPSPTTPESVPDHVSVPCRWQLHKVVILPGFSPASSAASTWLLGLSVPILNKVVSCQRCIYANPTLQMRLSFSPVTFVNLCPDKSGFLSFQETFNRMSKQTKKGKLERGSGQKQPKQATQGRRLKTRGNTQLIRQGVLVLVFICEYTNTLSY